MFSLGSRSIVRYTKICRQWRYKYIDSGQTNVCENNHFNVGTAGRDREDALAQMFVCAINTRLSLQLYLHASQCRACSAAGSDISTRQLYLHAPHWLACSAAGSVLLLVLPVACSTINTSHASYYTYTRARLPEGGIIARWTPN